MKVTEYEGHKVPEGATKYQSDSGRFHESFWDNNGNVWVIGIAEEWLRAESVIPQGLIELPEQPTKADEWDGKGLPPENIQCLFEAASRIGNERKVCITGVMFTSVDGEKRLCEVDGQWFDGFEGQFYPLKTAEEKKREAFIEKGLLAAKESVIGWGADEATAFLDDLLIAGFTAPKGGE